MKVYTVGDLKSKFSEVLDQIQEGEDVYVAYGKKKEIIAHIVPYKKPGKKKKRKLGLLKGKGSVKFMPDFKMTDEELINL
jgi:antitoxin (DNA-binding transcriptional repressor) of toxin-antitoxin stability system